MFAILTLLPFLFIISPTILLLAPEWVFYPDLSSPYQVSGKDILLRHESVHKKKNQEEHQQLMYVKGRV